MKQVPFKNYTSYVEAQITRTEEKLAASPKILQASAGALENLAEWLMHRITPLNLGLCHGVRTGRECEMLRELLKIDVIGTDVVPSAGHLDNCIVMDFQYRKPEWDDRFDFIYCNCLDHAFDPDRCIRTWLLHIKETGCLAIEWTSQHNHAKKVDCFGASLTEYVKLLNTHGRVVNKLEGTKGGQIIIVRRSHGNSR